MEKPMNPLIPEISKVICDYYGLNLEQVRTKTRKRPIVIARNMIMKFIKKKNSKITQEEIAEYLGLDRSTINTGIISIEKDIRIYKHGIGLDYKKLGNIILGTDYPMDEIDEELTTYLNLI